MKQHQIERYCEEAELRRKLSKAKAFLFDWDGVFNAGFKSDQESSPFSEADSMGVNLLRYGHWLSEGSLPITGIITGQLNEVAVYFARREHIDFCFRGFKHKLEAFRQFLSQTGLQANQVAYFFDDVLDLGIAGQCGLRICIRQFPDGPFREFVKDEGLADLVSGVRGGEHAVREMADYLLQLSGAYEKVVRGRITYHETYRNYLEQRNAVSPQFTDADT